MNEKNKKKFKTALISFTTIATSLLIGMTASCSSSGSTDKDDEEDKVTTKQDTQTLKNGNFEFYDDNDGLYPISSPDNWSGGTRGYSSAAKSGIINTARWDYLTDPTLPKTLEDNDDLKSDDENKKDYGDSLTDDMLYKDTHAATKSNASTDDKAYIENPSTHEYKIDAEGKVTDSEGNAVTTYKDEKTGKVYTDADHKNELEASVLMLHNYRSSYYTGTESYYKSSTTITLEASTAAEISLWVKTSELYFDGSSAKRTKVVDKHGAYVQVDTTVGGNALDKVVIKNINTENLNPDNENNGWVQYTVYVQASSFAETTVTLTLGLGEDSSYTVEGYAFFDDVTFTKYENADAMVDAVNEGHTADYFSNLVANSTSQPLSTDPKTEFRTDVETVTTNNEQGEVVKKELKHNSEDRHYYVDFASSSVKNAVQLTPSTVEAGLTVEKTSKGKYVSSKGVFTNELTVLQNGAGNAYLPPKLGTTGIDVGDDLLTAINVTDAEDWKCTKGGAYADILTKALKSAATLPGVTGGNTDALVMLSTHGAAYEAKISNPNFTLNHGEYMLVSFWIKTADMNGKTAATVTVRDTDETSGKSANFSLDSTTVSTVTINDKEDVYDGWVQCFARVSNVSDEDGKTFELRVNFGNTTINGTTNSSYTAGWVALTNASAISVDEDVFGFTSDAAHSASITYDKTAKVTNHNFDSEQGDKNIIKEDVAIPSSYTGVNGASAEVIALGNKITDYDETNNNPYAGLINKENFATYLERANAGTGCDWLNAITAITNKDWNTLAGEYTVQPLLIVNTFRQFKDKASAVYNYGYVGGNSTLSANSYVAVSVKVKVSKGAVANVYLVDTDTSSKKVLGYDLPAYTFWYDDDNNILKGEPDEHASVAQQKANIAYTLRKDGLYENGDGKLYANLYNLSRYYDVEFEHEDFYKDGQLVAFEDLVQGEVYYADAASTKYAPHYLIAGDEVKNKVYKYNSGLDASASYFYMESGKVNTGKVVYGVDTQLATLRYDHSNRTATPYQFTIDATTPEGEARYADKWVTVTFYLHSGSESKNYKLELWSGARDAETSNQQDGSFVMFDYSMSTLDETTYNNLVNKYTDDILNEYKKVLPELEDNDGNISDLEKLAGSEHKSDIYNYDAEYYTFSLFDSAAFIPFNGETATDDQTGYNYTYSDYEESLAFLKVEDTDPEKTSALSMSAFINYSVIDKDIDIIGTPTVDDDTDDTTTTTENTNIWLLAASIVLVVAIFVAIAAIIIRDLLKKRGGKKTASKNSYNYNRNKRYVKKYVKANGEAPSVEEGSVDQSLLNDTPAENAETAETTENEAPAESAETPAETEAPAESAETPAENEAPAESETPASEEQSEQPAEAEKPEPEEGSDGDKKE